MIETEYLSFNQATIFYPTFVGYSFDATDKFTQSIESLKQLEYSVINYNINTILIHCHLRNDGKWIEKYFMFCRLSCSP